MEKPTLPKGTRDFGPAQMAKRQFILENIKKVFQKYGFQPLETPAMENLSTLTGKYGEEGDQLIFKVLESGDYLNNLKEAIIKRANQKNSILCLKSIFKEMWTEVFERLSNERINDIYAVQSIIRERALDLIIKHTKLILVDEAAVILKIFIEDDLYVADLFIRNFKLHGITHDNYVSKIQEILDPIKDSEFIKNAIEGEFLDRISRNYLGLLERHAIDLKRNPSQLLTRDISEKGLRYDLTVPFARYVVMNRHEITLPFKRYQIQPVWRADRPQKGRYREFYQCDADVVGTNSLICEAEIILMIKEAFKGLGIEDYTIKTNHRGILSGLAELCGTKENETALFVAIDKLDKIGEEKVKEELLSRGFPESSLTTLFEILNFKGTTQQKIEFLSKKFVNTPSGQKGVSDFSEVLTILSGYGVAEDHVEFDIALARGLSYYTGCIFEVKINNVAIGSVSGGGRYDNLTQAFGAKEQLSGVGISFGIDRIYDAMEELKRFPQEAQISTQVLIAHFDEESKRYGLKVLQALRDNGIASEIYPDSVKIQKQLDFANKKMIPYSIVIGSEEMKSGALAFKNMKTGEQQKLTIEKILDTFK